MSLICSISDRLYRDFRLPTFVLVDADPYGIEIMCVYRYGSLSMAYSAEATAVPDMKWMGLLPSDLDDGLDGEVRPFSASDAAKCRALMKRPYMTGALHHQVETLARRGLKAELQSLGSPSDYIIHQLISGRWI